MRLFGLGIRLYAIVNTKAAQWLHCRKNIFEHLKQIARKHPVYWVHCASLGEYEQAMPLIEALKKKYTDIYVLVSFFSPSGYRHYKPLAAVNEYCCLPLDTPYNANQFITIIQPRKVFFIKYEFWYNYIFELKNRAVPIYLVSGIFRSHQLFFKPWGGFFRKGLHCFTHFFVQNQHSVELLKTIGIINNITLAGDTRFDRVVTYKAAPFHNTRIEEFITGKKIIVAGSTWQEDDIILQKIMHALGNDWRLILAPHEVSTQKNEALKKLFHELAFYTDSVAIPPHTQVLVIDTIGILSLLYRYANICYIGGGFGKGIHNTLEAIVYNKPVFFGPQFQKFEEAHQIIAKGIGKSIQTPEQGLAFIAQVQQNANTIETQIEAFVKSNVNAVDKIVDIV